MLKDLESIHTMMFRPYLYAKSQQFSSKASAQDDSGELSIDEMIAFIES